MHSEASRWTIAANGGLLNVLMLPLGIASGTTIAAELDHAGILWVAIALALIGPELTAKPTDNTAWLAEEVHTLRTFAWTSLVLSALIRGIT